MYDTNVVAPDESRVAPTFKLRRHLSEVGWGSQKSRGQHPGLVPVVPCAPVALPERPRQGNLRDLFASTKRAELGPARVDFPTGDEAHLAAQERDAVIGDYTGCIDWSGVSYDPLLIGQLAS